MDELAFVRTMRFTSDIFAAKRDNGEAVFQVSRMGARGIATRQDHLQVEVKRSHVHGRGVFATEDIPAGMVVAIYPVDAVCDPTSDTARLYTGANINSFDNDAYTVLLNPTTAILGSPEFTDGAAVAHIVNDPYKNTTRLAEVVASSPASVLADAMLDYLVVTETCKNCVLVRGSHYCYVRTTAPVAAGKELLAPYGYAFWLPEGVAQYSVDAAMATLSKDRLKKWLPRIAAAAKDKSEPPLAEQTPTKEELEVLRRYFEVHFPAENKT